MCPFYIRMLATDQPGVSARSIANALLPNAGVSLAAVQQKGEKDGRAA